MEIILDIKNPKDNSNKSYGSVSLTCDNKYMHIRLNNSEVVSVYSNELYNAINALYK